MKIKTLLLLIATTLTLCLITPVNLAAEEKLSVHTVTINALVNGSYFNEMGEGEIKKEISKIINLALPIFKENFQTILLIQEIRFEKASGIEPFLDAIAKTNDLKTITYKEIADTTLNLSPRAIFTLQKKRQFFPNGYFETNEIFILCLINPAVPTDNEKLPLRIVTIGALVDKDYLNKAGEKGAEKEINEIIDFASKIFEQEFAIKFKLTEIRPWNFPVGKEEIDGYAAIDDVKIISDGLSSDITIAFSQKNIFICAKKNNLNLLLPKCPDGKTKTIISGIAWSHLSDTATVRLYDKAKYVALHEISHLFGAIDIDIETPHSIMFWQITSTTKFDEENKQTIMKNRNRKFK